jgi:hypothetical protein
MAIRRAPASHIARPQEPAEDEENSRENDKEAAAATTRVRTVGPSRAVPASTSEPWPARTVAHVVAPGLLMKESDLTSRTKRARRSVHSDLESFELRERATIEAQNTPRSQMSVAGTTHAGARMIRLPPQSTCRCFHADRFRRQLKVLSDGDRGRRTSAHESRENGTMESMSTRIA